MQIIQRGLDEKDSCYLIYNTAVFLDLELLFWILNSKTLCKSCKPSFNFSFQIYKSFQKSSRFLYRIRQNGYGLIREEPCQGNGRILPIPAISRDTSIKCLVEIRVIIDNGDG